MCSSTSYSSANLSPTDLKRKLYMIEETFITTRTESEFIVGSENWRIKFEDGGSAFRLYKDFIDCNEVFPNIIVGNEKAALTREFLRDINVTHVLNCAFGRCFNSVNTNEEFYQEFNIRYKGLPLDDMPSEDIARFFFESFEFIDEAISQGGKVLIHCYAGISRSATIALAYLIKRYGMSLEEAAVTVKSKRRICPNEGFLRQLVIFESQETMGKNQS